MVELNKNRSENFLAFVSTRARSGSRPTVHVIQLPLVGQSCHMYHSPVNSGLWSGVVVVLVRRLQRRYNIVSAVDRSLVFAGSILSYHTSPANTSR